MAALLAGCAAGGALLSMTHWTGANLGLLGAWEDRQLGALLGWFIIGAFAYGVGLLAASPFWYALHAAGLRGWRAAAGLGAFLTVLAYSVFALVNSVRISTASDFWFLAEFLGVMSLLSAVVGIVVWRVAYRPAREGPSLPALADIERATFYKRDLITVDLVCCDLLVRGAIHTFHEDMPDWSDLLRRLEQLPGFRTDWPMAVVHPPFSTSPFVAWPGEV
jgi:hypothetical protein